MPNHRNRMFRGKKSSAIIRHPSNNNPTTPTIFTEMTLEQFKYPIGKFENPETITEEILAAWISAIAAFPHRLKNEVNGLNQEQLDTPYRPEGWTIRQLIHHCADSHINSYTRFKLTLTEDRPTIKPYWEDRWAELIDSKTLPVEYSINLLDGLHARWVGLLHSLTAQDFAKTFIHPEHKKEISLNEYVGFYAWHCNHHLAHITGVKKRNNWT
jgi:hypothetical protein